MSAPKTSAAPDLSAFEAALTPLKDYTAVVLAVSGGPDSLALMRLVAHWLATQSAPPTIFIASVDHGLRAASADEAQFVARWAQTLKLPHKVLHWQGEKPKTRLQERARAARYDLLTSYAHEVGAEALVTAHHMDDQAETILFRALRGSGPAGLSGMAPRMRRGSIDHLRPLLDFSKADLVQVCERFGQPFIEDPSNRDLAFARVKMRQLLPVLADHGLGAEEWVRLGARMARMDAALSTKTDELMARLDVRISDGEVRLMATSLAHEPLELVIRLLRQLIAHLTSDTPVLRLERLETAGEQVQAALQQGKSHRQSLSNILIQLDKFGLLVLRFAPQRRRGQAAPLPGKDDFA